MPTVRLQHPGVVRHARARPGRSSAACGSGFRTDVRAPRAAGGDLAVRAWVATDPLVRTRVPACPSDTCAREPTFCRRRRCRHPVPALPPSPPAPPKPPPFETAPASAAALAAALAAAQSTASRPATEPALPPPPPPNPIRRRRRRDPASVQFLNTPLCHPTCVSWSNTTSRARSTRATTRTCRAAFTQTFVRSIRHDHPAARPAAERSAAAAASRLGLGQAGGVARHGWVGSNGSGVHVFQRVHQPLLLERCDRLGHKLCRGRSPAVPVHVHQRARMSIGCGSR